MNETIDTMMNEWRIPLSIIFVGSVDFGNMSILDGDDTPLISSSCQKMKRDLVQIVPFYHFQ
jgi:hypothetical protein